MDLERVETFKIFTTGRHEENLGSPVFPVVKILFVAWF
jgi:hypothetical protein